MQYIQSMKQLNRNRGVCGKPQAVEKPLFFWFHEKLNPRVKRLNLNQKVKP